MTWPQDVRLFLEAESPFQLINCEKQLVFRFPWSYYGMFTRESKKESGSTTSTHQFVDFGIYTMLNRPINTFQTEILSMTFDNVDFNWFANPHSPNNSQYATALTNRILKLYQESWIGQYFNVEVQKHDGNVFFYDLKTQAPSESYRYKIFVFVPEQTKPYFLSKQEWNSLLNNDNVGSISTDLISSVTHGFRTIPAPATKSCFYSPPFFVKLKTPLITSNNYMVYQKQFKPNLECTILAMLVHDYDSDTLTVQFAPTVKLPFVNALVNNTLEFVLLDSTMQQISIEDGCQLFFSISIV